mmetsp:Transcript_17612/g.45503  ORF Transcript_17612/g.45503 Transcript_17612/m.45503 type:complete len:201 (+) Transcript_17612:331-933(+)
MSLFGAPCARAWSSVAISAPDMPSVRWRRSRCAASSSCAARLSWCSCSAAARRSFCSASKAASLSSASCCACSLAILCSTRARSCSLARRSSASACSCSCDSRSSTRRVRRSIESSCIFCSRAGAMYPRKTTLETSRPMRAVRSARLRYTRMLFSCSADSLKLSKLPAAANSITSLDTALMSSAIGSWVASSIFSTSATR